MTNKYEYLKVIQGNYGYGWEDLTAEEDYKEARLRLREYRDNDNYGCHRMIERRVLK